MAENGWVDPSSTLKFVREQHYRQLQTDGEADVFLSSIQVKR